MFTSTSNTPKLQKSIRKPISRGSHSKPISKRSSGNFTTVNMYTINNGDNINIEEVNPINRMIEATNTMIDTLTASTCEAAAEACEAAAESAENASKSAMKIAGRMVKKYKHHDDKIKQSQIQMAEVIAEAAVATATAAKLGAKVCRISNNAMTTDPQDILKYSEEENSDDILNRAVMECSDEENSENNPENDFLQPVKITPHKNRKRKNSTPCEIVSEKNTNFKRSISVGVKDADESQTRGLIDDVKNKIDVFCETELAPIVDIINEEAFKTVTNVKDDIDNLTEKTISNIKDGIDVVSDTVTEVVNNVVNEVTENTGTHVKDMVNKIEARNNDDKHSIKKVTIKRRGLNDITELIDKAVEEFEVNIEETKNEALNVIATMKTEFIDEITTRKEELLTSFNEKNEEQIETISKEFKDDIEVLVTVLQNTINEHKETINHLITNLEEKIKESEDGVSITNTEVDRMLTELNDGLNDFDAKIKIMRDNYIKSLDQITSTKYIETIEIIKNAIATELQKVDDQLSNKFQDFNLAVDNLITSVHNGEVEKINEDIRSMSEQFKNVTNFEVFLKQITDLIENEVFKLKNNAFELSDCVKTEIKNIITELKEEFKLIVSNAKTKMKLFISEFEKISSIVSQKKDEFVLFITNIFNDKSNNFVDNITNWINQKKDELDDFLEKFNIKKRGVLDDSFEELKKLISDLELKFNNELFQVKTDLEFTFDFRFNEIKTELKQECNDNLIKFKNEFNDEIESRLAKQFTSLKSEINADINLDTIMNEIEFKITKLKTDLELRLIEIINSIDTKIDSKFNHMFGKYDQLNQIIKTYDMKLELINTQVDKLETTMDLKYNELDSNTTTKIREELKKIESTPPNTQGSNQPIRLSNFTMNRIAKKIKSKL